MVEFPLAMTRVFEGQRRELADLCRECPGPPAGRVRFGGLEVTSTRSRATSTFLSSLRTCLMPTRVDAYLGLLTAVEKLLESESPVRGGRSTASVT